MPDNMSSFEASLAELEEILQKMNDDALGLDASIDMYAKAAELIAGCRSSLDSAQVRIQEIGERIQHTLQEGDGEF